MAVPFYKPFVNAFGLKVLTKTPAIPDAKLMVGAMEVLEPVPLLIYKDLSPVAAPAVMKPYDQLTLEEAAEKLVNEGLTVDDFPGNTLYLGDPTAAV